MSDSFWVFLLDGRIHFKWSSDRPERVFLKRASLLQVSDAGEEYPHVEYLHQIQLSPQKKYSSHG